MINACCQEKTILALCGSLSLQEQLLTALASVPFPVRLPFLEILACHSLILVAALMHEKSMRETKQKEADFVYHSSKHAFALKTLYEIFDPAYLSHMLIQPERKRDG